MHYAFYTVFKKHPCDAVQCHLLLGQKLSDFNSLLAYMFLKDVGLNC